MEFIQFSVDIYVVKFSIISMRRTRLLETYRILKNIFFLLWKLLKSIKRVPSDRNTHIDRNSSYWG